MGRIEKRLPKKVMDVLEACGWKLNSIEKQNGEYCAEIENWSPAGEDLPETIWYNGTGKGFVEAVQEWASDYDADEHAEMWVESRGKRGVPNSIRALVNDADAIGDMFDDLAEALSRVY